MSEMKMNYIFIEKETQDSLSMCEQIAELLGVEDSKMKSGNLPTSGFICLQDVEVFYEISGKSGADQYFLELSTKARVNRAVIALQTLDDTIYQSPKQKYYTAIRVYDGISESYCKRLYPKYAEFERLLRALVSLIVTKAYGSAWREETVPEEMMADLKKNARGNLPISETLEQMDLSTVEEYLFAEREVVYEEVVAGSGENANGTAGKIADFEQLSKEELCRLLEELRQACGSGILNHLEVRKSGKRKLLAYIRCATKWHIRNGSAARNISSTGSCGKCCQMEYNFTGYKKYADDSGSII